MPRVEAEHGVVSGGVKAGSGGAAESSARARSEGTAGEAHEGEDQGDRQRQRTRPHGPVPTTEGGEATEEI